jgi:hypothetical protein
MEHGVYLYEYAGDENNYLQDIRLFDGAQVEIETQTTMVLKTENAQLADMEYMENPQTEEYVLDSTDLQTAGTDFAEGVYDLTVLEGRGSINVDICDAGGGVIATCYMYLGENASYGMTYQNLVLPEGAVITLDEGLSVQMTPSERIESTDYLGYYED